jgi:molybdopterin molybdotransferase
VSRFVGHGRHEVTPREELISVEAHLEALLAQLPTPDPIELRLADALGLVLADDVTSEVTVPAFANSAMDGYAVIARDVRAATEDEPIRLAVDGEVAAGVQELPTVRPATASGS